MPESVTDPETYPAAAGYPNGGMQNMGSGGMGGLTLGSQQASANFNNSFGRDSSDIGLAGIAGSVNFGSNFGHNSSGVGPGGHTASANFDSSAFVGLDGNTGSLDGNAGSYLGSGANSGSRSRKRDSSFDEEPAMKRSKP